MTIRKSSFQAKIPEEFAKIYLCRWDLALLNTAISFIALVFLIDFIWAQGLYFGSVMPNIFATLIAAAFTVFMFIATAYISKAHSNKANTGQP